MPAEPQGPFVLVLRELEEGENRLERAGTSADLGIQPDQVALAGRVVLRCVVYRSRDRAEVQGTVSALVDLACDRCLAPIRRTLLADLRVFGERRGRRDHRSEEEVREEDIGIVYHDGRFVDLTDEVRQVLLLEVPWHIVCRENCRGLCQRCGSDLNQGFCRCPAEEAGAGPGRNQGASTGAGFVDPGSGSPNDHQSEGE